MTIGKKLMISITALLFLTAALGGAYLYSVAGLSEELAIATDSTAKKILLLSELKVDLQQLRSSQRGVMLFSIGKAPEKARSNKEQFEASASETEALLVQLKPLLVTERGKKGIAFIESGLPGAKNYFGQIAAAALAGDAQTAFRINEEYSIKSFDALEAAVQDVLTVQKQLLKEGSDRGAADSARARWIAYICLLVALAISPFIVLTVLGTTRRLLGVAAHLAEGAEQITSASSQVASSSQTLAQGASEQAASLEETSSSSEQITSMTRKNAENSQSAAVVMAEVDQRVAEGNRTLGEMVQSMREITGSSDKISKIIKVIDEIAFQTNILALNAAVEAARAGEAGMGFAVVADEVRNLAQRSAQAAKDTASLIEESIAKSNEGSQRLEHVTQVIRAITESAAKVKTLVDEVNLGSQEQARGIEQISKSIAEMDRVTQANAASAEESASASEQMSAQAEALQQIAQELRRLVGGGETDGPEDESRRPTHQMAPRPLALTPSPTKLKDLAALRSAVTPARKSTGPAVSMEDDFVKM